MTGTHAPVAERAARSSHDGENGCRVWDGRTGRGDGYGRIAVAVGTTSKLAHRVAWEIANGPVPGGLQLDHTCFNRACIRVEHLRLVSPKQNAEHLQGARSHSRSGVRGVRIAQVRADGTQTYTASATYNGRRIHLGTYDTIEDAAARAARQRLYTHDDYPPERGEGNREANQ